MLRVSLAWMPLLFGNREVKALDLYGPSAGVSRGLDGQLNIADLFQRRHQDSYTLKLDRLTVREGTLLLSDQLTHTDKRLASISLTPTICAAPPTSASAPSSTTTGGRCGWR